MKITSFNPFFTNKFTKNRYNNLPKHMIIFQSCYPLRLQRKITCSKDTINILIKIFQLKNIETNLNNLIKQNSLSLHDTWREVLYYEYVRNNIIKKKVSPNFVMMYAYFISQDNDLKFTELNDEIERKTKTRELGSELKQKYDELNKAKNSFTITATGNVPIMPQYPQLEVNYLEQISNKNLILLTESPSKNLLKWASAEFTDYTSVKTMKSTGYHADFIWKSIIFQLFSALYVMKLHDICFKEFSIEENVFIKEMNVPINILGYWKYIIDGTSFYIPNYGFLVMIDSNFKDIDFTNNILTQNITYKINGNMFTNNDKNCNSKDNFNIIDPNMFDTTFQRNNGMKPSQDIINLLANIKNDLNTKNYNEILINHFKEYLHNRIGTFASFQELQNKSINTINVNTSKGKIVLYDTNGTDFKFVLLLDNNQMFDGSNISDIQLDQLYNYNDNLQQKYTSTLAKFNEDDLLETYYINK